MEEDEIICPKCGEKENFHFNYDYSKKELPIIDVLCNECGEYFKLDTPKIKNMEEIEETYYDKKQKETLETMKSGCHILAPVFVLLVCLIIGLASKPYFHELLNWISR
jgi:uncharacterized Zn finger protein